MKKAGILLIALGIFSVFLAFNMDVVIGTSYNIGLLNERQNIVYLSGVLFLAGIMLFGFGVVAKEESENLKTFTLLTFLIPIVLVVIIKIISDIQAEKSKQVALKMQQAEEAALEVQLTEHAQKTQTEVKFLKENMDKFIDNKNGTVTFKSNGLMWQRCSVGQTWTGETCSGEAKTMTWDDAMKLSNRFAGYNDWRLPTREELKTLVFCSDGEYDSNSDWICTNNLKVTHPTINSLYFPNTQSYSYWSSLTFSSSSALSSKAWFVHFFSGNYRYGDKDDNYSVRLVR